MLRPVKNDYTLNVHTIDVEQKDAEKYIYNFSVEVEHQKDGITEMKTVTGQANFNEAHKVEYMLIRANDL